MNQRNQSLINIKRECAMGHIWLSRLHIYRYKGTYMLDKSVFYVYSIVYRFHNIKLVEPNQCYYLKNEN